MWSMTSGQEDWYNGRGCNTGDKLALGMYSMTNSMIDKCPSSTICSTINALQDTFIDCKLLCICSCLACFSSLLLSYWVVAAQL
jgi:hypothetical protein